MLLASLAMAGGNQRLKDAMVRLVEQTVSVSETAAMEVSALMSQPLATPVGTHRLIDATISNVKETTNARVDHVLEAPAVRQRTIATIGLTEKLVAVQIILVIRILMFSSVQMATAVLELEEFFLAALWTFTWILVAWTMSQLATQARQRVTITAARAALRPKLLHHAKKLTSQPQTDVTASFARVPISAAATPAMGSSRLARLLMSVRPSLVQSSL